MDVTSSGPLGGDNETNKAITLQEIAKKGKEKVVQEWMERMEKQMETLTAILYEMRNERKDTMTLP